MIVVIAEPDARCFAARVADEPGVAVILTGAGLASGEAVTERGAHACAIGHHLTQHVIHGQRIALIGDSDAGGRRGEKNLAVHRRDLADTIRHGALTKIAEGRIGRRQFQQRDFRTAERDGEVRLDGRQDAETRGGVGNGRYADLLAELDRDRVD